MQAMVRYLYTNNGTEFINQTLRSYIEDVGISHQMSIARTLQQNGVVESEDLGKLKPKADIGPELQSLTSRQISSRLVLNQATSVSAKPPLKDDLDLLFQPMFDEYFKPSPSDVSPTTSIATLPKDTARAYSSTTIDQDAPYPTTSTNIETTTPLIQSTNVEEQNQDNEDAKIDSYTFTNPFAPPKTSSAESLSSRIIDNSNMHTFHQPHSHNIKWTKDHPLTTIISNPSKLVSTRLKKELYGLKQASKAWYYMLLKFLLSQKFVKDVVGLQVSQNPRGIFINQSKYALEMLKKYGLESCNVVDTLMVERSKLDYDSKGTPIDPTHYHSMTKLIEKPLTAVKQVFRYLKGTINMGVWYPKDTGFGLTVLADVDHADALTVDRLWILLQKDHVVLRLQKRDCLVLRHRSTLEDEAYYSSIPLYQRNKLRMRLLSYTLSRHINWRISLQKALGRERFKFLLNRLDVQSITHEELKSLAESDGE
ncbi:retrovirus-related pol polyprotein from transposon TNT 1-94 [Tanacetum coccineum]